MLIGGVIQHQIHKHANPSPVRFADQAAKVAQRAEPWIDGAVIRDVVAEIFHRRGINRRKPDGIDAQRMRRAVIEVIQPADDARYVTDPVAVRVLKTPRIDLIDDGMLPPEGIVRHAVTFMATSNRFSSRAFLTAFPLASLLKYTNTSRPSRRYRLIKRASFSSMALE